MSFGGAKRRRLPGQEFSWESGGGEQDTAPTPLFPKYRVGRARPLSTIEAAQVRLYKQLRERWHDGPYYVEFRQSPGGSPGSASLGGATTSQPTDPFNGMATYGQRYQRKTRTLPKLAGRSYGESQPAEGISECATLARTCADVLSSAAMHLFPKELWKTLDPNYVGLSTGSEALASRKRGFEDDDLPEEGDDADTKRRSEGAGTGAGRAGPAGGEEDGEEGDRHADGEDDDDLLDDEEAGEEEPVDDDFEEDDDEMADDYNAEQYFDGGDDAEDFDLGGGDEGDVY
ncbi:hypothetical protein KEM52_004488 [Ascosphaera acerosa]|nr:hypothetical protein KEM52_004488 [Ascosphaera acerosa]